MEFVFSLFRSYGLISQPKNIRKKIGSLEDQANLYKKEIGSLRHKNSELHRNNLHLKEIINPIRKKAEELYPELKSVAAIEKLSQDIRRVYELATRDIYRPLDEEIRNKSTESFQSIYIKYSDIKPRIIIETQSGNDNRVSISRDFIKMLKLSGFNIEWQLNTIQVIGGPKAPISFVFHPKTTQFAKDFISALPPFFNSKIRIVKNNDFPTATIKITIFGVPQFRSNGTVFFKLSSLNPTSQNNCSV